MADINLSTLNNAQGFRILGVNIKDAYGYPSDGTGNAVRNAGDVNGDGYADVIVGAGFTSTISMVGKCYVIFCKPENSLV